MRVLVLLTDAFGGKGGIALYNRDLLTALCAHPDCDEVIAIPRLIPGSIEPLPDKLTYITEGVGSKFGFITSVFKAAKRHKPIDLIICGHINLLPIAYLLKVFLNAPLVLEIYGIDAWKPTRSKLINILSRKIDYVVSISEITRKRFLNWCKVHNKHTFLLPNAIHLEEYGETSSTLQSLQQRYSLQGKTVLMTLGRMSTQEQYKGFEEVLNVLPELIKQVPNIVYMAVGDGDDKQRLAQIAQELGVEDHFILPGYIKEEEKADHYRLADVYVMPSYGEGFGFVLLEAMACGVPVIASKTDGTKEAVRDGILGHIVDPSDAKELKDAIIQTLKKPKGIPEGLKYFSFENFNKRLHKIIDNIMDDQK